MHKHKLRGHLARAAAVGFAGLTASLVVGAGMASASTPADPQGGATPVAPHFYNGNVEGIRDTGSDTTFFMMQKIGDLYTGGGLYGCTLNGSAGQTLFNSSDPASATSNLSFFCQAGQNVSTTDINDNWDRTEVTEGVDNVGSGAGQNQLCGSGVASSPLPVDFARSSKPEGTACGTLSQTGYAKDGVPIIDYPLVNPDVQNGVATTAPYSTINGGVIGPVSQGWLPGDSPSGTFTGTKFADVDNTGGATSLAYRMWCASDSTRVTDWGQLTNLGPNLLVTGVTTTSGSNAISATSTFPTTVAAGDAISGTGIPSGTTISTVSGSSATLSNSATASGTGNVRITTASTLAEGSGAPIGVPLRLMGVNTASGTEATFASFAESGVASGGCSANMNTNDASDPNPVTKTGSNASPHVALENNSDQINQFAAGDFPGDFASQAIEAATTLYIESNGVFNTDPFSADTTINGVSFSGAKLKENNVGVSAATELNNTFPTARTLFNIYRTDTIRASTAGFLNWICDGNTNFSKGEDNSTGLNFDTELGNNIGTVFGFPRLTDATPPAATGTPADGIAAPNNSCAANLPVSTTSGSNTITLTAGGNFAPDIVNAGGLVGGGSVGLTGAGIPAGTTVVSGAGTSTLTLSNAATATGTGVATAFSGVPSVTSVPSVGSQS
jgi:hypothetical protein